MPVEDSASLIQRLLAVVEQDIVPLTRQGVRTGNKIFGAAILRKAVDHTRERDRAQGGGTAENLGEEKS